MRLRLMPLAALALAALLLYCPQARAQADSNAQAHAQTQTQAYAHASGTGVAAPTQDRELWTGSVYTSTFRIGFCLNGEEVKGVVLLRTWTGEVDTYHFYGSMHNGVIEARHNSGHKFRGGFTSNSQVKGQLKLKSGRTVEVKADRHHNANLNADCRPTDK